MRVEPPGSHDVAFPGDDFGGGADQHVFADPVLDSRIAPVSDSDDASAFDSDIGFNHAQFGVEDRRVSDDQIEGVFLNREGRLAHAVADDFASAEFNFVTVSTILGDQVALHFN